MPYRVVLDDEVVAMVKEAAEPLVDSVNSVVRRKLGLPPGSREPIFFEVEHVESAANGRAPAETVARTVSPPRRETRRGRARAQGGHGKNVKRTRAPKGSILDERAYWEPILRVVDAAGGSAAAREVVDRVGEIVADQLTPLDLEPLETGGVRWQNRVQFARLRMKERGLLDDAPRGIWKISEAGRQALKSGQVAAR